VGTLIVVLRDTGQGLYALGSRSSGGQESSGVKIGAGGGPEELFWREGGLSNSTEGFISTDPKARVNMR